jgi:hypothetical protein
MIIRAYRGTMPNSQLAPLAQSIDVFRWSAETSTITSSRNSWKLQWTDFIRTEYTRDEAEEERITWTAWKGCKARKPNSRRGWSWLSVSRLSDHLASPCLPRRAPRADELIATVDPPQGWKLRCCGQGLAIAEAGANSSLDRSRRRHSRSVSIPTERPVDTHQTYLWPAILLDNRHGGNDRCIPSQPLSLTEIEVAADTQTMVQAANPYRPRWAPTNTTRPASAGGPPVHQIDAGLVVITIDLLEETLGV